MSANLLILVIEFDSKVIQNKLKTHLFSVKGQLTLDHVSLTVSYEGMVRGGAVAETVPADTPQQADHSTHVVYWLPAREHGQDQSWRYVANHVAKHHTYGDSVFTGCYRCPEQLSQYLSLAKIRFQRGLYF